MFSKTLLKGKTALVTGSSSGIGKGIALQLAQVGANIIQTGLEPRNEVELVSQQISGIRNEYVQVDFSEPSAITHMMNSVGNIDILVNNAGMQHVAPMVDFPPEIFEKIIRVNLNSSFYTIQAALPNMLKNNWGRIINIVSTHGKVASVNKVPYVSAKHGLIGMSKAVALETAKTGVTCNAICPGWVLTPLVQKQIDIIAQRDSLSNEEATEKLLAEKQPSLQFVFPKDVGDQVVFLCSEAAKNIRGADIMMDGAWTVV